MIWSNPFNETDVKEKKMTHRFLTLIVYLNPFWKPDDGGKLVVLENREPDAKKTYLTPTMGKATLFRADKVYHGGEEVIGTSKRAVSLFILIRKIKDSTIIN